MIATALALSGGGSRAAAFHRGVLQGLRETGLLGEVGAVSTVSGGSVFGAAWMAARLRGEDDGAFLTRMGEELERGFIGRTLRPRLLKTLLPGYTRTNALAETFDGLFFGGLSLKDLPAAPRLVMNVTVLNHGQVGKFAREGFKCAGLSPPEGGDPWAPLPGFPLALAAAASAAFPVGLPPVYLRRGAGGIPEGWGLTPGLREAKTIALTDGGVLENLGVQTLLDDGGDFAAWDLVVSDAGPREREWAPGGLVPRLRGLVMGAVSAPVLERISVLMNNKEDRHMRHRLFEERERSWLVEALRDPRVAARPDLRALLEPEPSKPARRVIMVRVSQDWDHFLLRIPKWRLLGLAASFEARTGGRAPALPALEDLPAKEAFLKAVGADLEPARRIWEEMGGAAGVLRANAVPTSFSALSREEVEVLYGHARWQVLSNKAVYWD
ncbi:MAG: patatin-like phospholipase family protein [Acidobacteriota bacterium]